jgi:hypothetical protein
MLSMRQLIGAEMRQQRDTIWLHPIPEKGKPISRFHYGEI